MESRRVLLYSSSNVPAMIGKRITGIEGPNRSPFRFLSTKELLNYPSFRAPSCFHFHCGPPGRADRSGEAIDRTPEGASPR